MGLRGVTALCASGVLLLSACSGSEVDAADPTPIATPTAITSSTVAPSATNKPASPTSEDASPPATAASGPVPVPTAARRHTAAGAEAFARHYVAQINRAWMTPDASALDGLSQESCKSCTNYYATAASMQKRDARYASLPLGLSDALLLPESTADNILTQFVFTQERARIVRADGTTEREVPREAAIIEIATIWNGSSWRIREIKVALAP